MKKKKKTIIFKKNSLGVLHSSPESVFPADIKQELLNDYANYIAVVPDSKVKKKNKYTNTNPQTQTHTHKQTYRQQMDIDMKIHLFSLHGFQK